MQSNENLLNASPKLNGWLTEKEMQALTGFKTTKLWQLRSKNLLVSSKIGTKIFYKVDSLIALLEKNAMKSGINNNDYSFDNV